MSESDAGGHDFVPSLVGSQRAAGAFDSDLSADENSHADPDSDREEHLLAPDPAAKRPRPVSMDTVKRSSDATFAEDAYVFDPEEEMVLELPSPDSPPIASNLFLKPAIYVSPNSPPTTNPRTRSPSPSSIFSVENAEIQVAKKVTVVEPPTRPTLVFISSLGSRSKGPKSRPSHARSKGNPRDRGSRMYPERTESTLNVPRLIETKATPPRDTTKPPAERATSNGPTPAVSTQPKDAQCTQSATINRVSEIPVLPYLPPSPRTHLQSIYHSRPRTSGCENRPQALSSASGRRLTETGRRPASIRSTSTSNISMPTYTSRTPSPFPEDPRHGYIAEANNDAASLLSRTCSPVSDASSPPSTFPSKRTHATGSGYSVSNLLTHRSPMMRRMKRKHSTSSSIASMSSLRSEMDVHNTASASASTLPAAAAASQPSLNTINHDAHVVRKSSQRRHARHNSSVFGGRGFMGLKLGKRSFTPV